MSKQRYLPTLALTLLLPTWTFAQTDPGADASAMPKVPAGFEVKFFARDPLVRHRIRQHQKVKALPPAVSNLLRSEEPRKRFACVDAIAQAKQVAFIPALRDQLATETDRVVYYAGWPNVAANAKFAFDLKADRLTMKYAEKPLAEFVFRDPTILRPYFANLHGPTGTKITRNHLPIPGKDATDHDTMHPGIWLGFGDISGVDFWRNRGRIQHVKFLTPPTATENQITFATESDLLTPDGKRMGTMVNRFTLSQRPAGWLIIWDATFTATERDLIFGDQEEMGFGARIASECTELKGGTLLNSHGVKSAKQTWGKPAAWCDYSGTKDGRRIGITLMPAPTNFRESWWHNRDYGVFVANAFGRAAMRQGAKSAVAVKKGESLRLIFGAMLHDGADYDPASEHKHFLKVVK